MSDQADERDGTGDEVTEAKGEPGAGAWSSPAPGPRWSEIASEAQPPGPAGPPPPPPGGTTPPGPGPTPPGPATEAGRSRRPSSLRSGAAPSEVPPPPARPSFPGLGSPPPASNPDTTGPGPVSEPPRTGKSGQVPSSSKSLVEKIPLGELQDLVKKRPEVGLGIAFAGGLVIATLLKRLGRR